MKGTLYIIPVLLGSDNAEALLPSGTLECIRNITVFIAEKSKSARQFLKIAGTPYAQQDITIMEIDKHGANNYSDFLQPALNGKDIGLLSEAGAPAVADPGSAFIYAAHKMGIRTVPLTGPSSILLALMASGLNGQSFCFHGYLPVNADERTVRIKQLEKDARSRNETQLFIETPYRNNQLIRDLLNSLSGDVKLCLAADITLPGEFIKTKIVEHWRKEIPDLNKRPCVFLIGV